MNTLTNVLDQMAAHDMPPLPSGGPVIDGRIHRYSRGKKAWYALREIRLNNGNEVIVGAFGYWRGQDNGAVPVKLDGVKLSEEERRQAKEKQQAFEKREAQKKADRAWRASNRATVQWRQADGIAVKSSYLDRKQVTGEHVRVSADGELLIPMCKFNEDGSKKIVGLQKILPDGAKRFNAGMDKMGSFLQLGGVDKDTEILLIGEGYATMRSVRMALQDKYPALVAFDCGNLLSVARTFRNKFPNLRFLFIADDDFRIKQRYIETMADDYRIKAPELDARQHVLKTPEDDTVIVTAGVINDPHGDEFITVNVSRNRNVRNYRFVNAGISHAKTAACDVGNAYVVYPVFKERGENKWTDFNDLHVNESLDVVREQLDNAVIATLKGEQIRLPRHETLRADEGGKGRQKKVKCQCPDFYSKLNTLMQQFTLIYGTDEAYDADTARMIRIGNLRLAYGNDEVKAWLNDPSRRMVDASAVVFDPGCKHDPETTVNMFKGIKVQPRQGSCRKILELVHHLCNFDPEIMGFLLRWVAYPLKNLGTKMRTSVICHGDEGSGKNLFFESVVKRIYGEYGAVIGSAQLESQFNGWASKKMFIVADEVVTRAELRSTKGRLKQYISGDIVPINPKGMSERQEENHMNIVFMSNELQPLILDETDRRYLVLWTPPKREKAFYREVAEEIENGGLEAFYHYLLHDVEFPKDFSEYSDPPMTDAKKNLIALGRDPAARFFKEWEAGFLPLPYICCSAMQLYGAFKRWCYLNGERFYPTQQKFSAEVQRVAGQSLKRKRVKYYYESDVKMRTMYVIGKKPDNKGLTDWVNEASDLFDSYLKKYTSAFSGVCGNEA